MDVTYISDLMNDEITYTRVNPEDSQCYFKATINFTNTLLNEQYCHRTIEANLSTLFTALLECLNFQVDQVLTLSLSALYSGSKSDLCFGFADPFCDFPKHPNPFATSLNAFCETGYIGLSYTIKPFNGPVSIPTIPLLRPSEHYYNFDFFRGQYILSQDHLCELINGLPLRDILASTQSLPREIYDMCVLLRKRGLLPYLSYASYPGKVVIENGSKVIGRREHSEDFRRHSQILKRRDVSPELLEILQKWLDCHPL